MEKCKILFYFIILIFIYKKKIIDLMLRMYELDLISNEMIFKEFFSENPSQIISTSKPKKKKNIEENKQTFGIFAGFFGNGNDDNNLKKQFYKVTEDCINQCKITELLNDVKELQESSLEYLIKALIISSIERSENIITNDSNETQNLNFEKEENNFIIINTEQKKENKIDNENEIQENKNNNEKKQKDDKFFTEFLLNIKPTIQRDIYTCMFCIQLITEISIENKERIKTIWILIFKHIENQIFEVISNFKKSGGLKKNQYIILDNLIKSILKLYIRLYTVENIRKELNELFLLINEIPLNILTFILPQLCNGILILIKTHTKNLNSAKVWDLILKIIKYCSKQKDSVLLAKETINLLVKGGFY
jgi:hypothetical protein